MEHRITKQSFAANEKKLTVTDPGVDTVSDRGWAKELRRSEKKDRPAIRRAAFCGLLKCRGDGRLEAEFSGDVDPPEVEPFVRRAGDDRWVGICSVIVVEDAGVWSSDLVHKGCLVADSQGKVLPDVKFGIEAQFSHE